MQQLSLIDDLESAIKQGSQESRVQTLRRITDLFLHDANRLNDEQIAVFDDVLCLLAEKIEKTALVELGSRLAPVDMAPIKVVRRLARDEEIAVAAPVLTGSKRLTTADLVEIAQTKSSGPPSGHLGAHDPGAKTYGRAACAGQPKGGVHAGQECRCEFLRDRI